MVCVQAQLSYRLCMAAARPPFQPGNGLLAGGLDIIRNAQIPGVAAIQRRTTVPPWRGGTVRPSFIRRALPAAAGAAIQLRLDAVSAQLLHIGDAAASGG